MIIRRVQEQDFADWYRLRVVLWTEADTPQDEQEMREAMRSERMETFVAVTAEGAVVGFLEANIRPYADGCDTRDVGYIEGWYVEETFRKQGVGMALMETAEDWARSKGCREMGSDCLQDNEISLAAHLALGYEEKERLVHFGKRL
ncbi:GNAT family N-acetyltransferase [bacterium]|nr:MAG: GNAT family N-acetyltransferase [bacterium]